MIIYNIQIMNLTKKIDNLLVYNKVLIIIIFLMIYNDNSCLNKKNQYYVNNIDTSINKYISYTNYNKKTTNVKNSDYDNRNINTINITFKRSSNRKNSPK